MIGQEDKVLIPLLIKGTVLFLFIMCILTVFFYAAGTRQDFTDRTQLMILRLSLLQGLFLGLGSAYGILYHGRFFFKKRIKSGLSALGAYLFSGSFGIGLAILSAFIIAAAEGSR
jgi:membrane-bound acyltransferase YfiQ involved in biofilm formation